MGATSPEPDDTHLFNAIISGLDADQLEHAAHAPEPQPQATPPVSKADPVLNAATPPTPPAPPADEFGMAVTVAPPVRTPPPAAPPVEPPATPKRTIRDALVDWIDRRSLAKQVEADRRSRSKKPETDNEITVGAFVTVCFMTLVVAGLAFALSFDMMLAAAERYGWEARMATLFPIIIDVGAIGGTFMGAISGNRTYRSIGHQVLVVTLAASVLFNLVGHDIRGGSVLGLPERWGWTGIVAAILIPLLLAYFVHAFSKALKEFVDQRRARKLAEQQRIEAEAAAERAAAEARRAERKTVTRVDPPARTAPAATVTATVTAAKPTPALKAEVAKADTDKVTRDEALEWARQQDEVPSAPQVLTHFENLGRAVPSDRAVRGWLTDLRDTNA